LLRFSRVDISQSRLMNVMRTLGGCSGFDAVHDDVGGRRLFGEPLF
jgi:hypothetical protein